MRAVRKRYRKRYRVTIEEPTETQAVGGTGQPTVAWTSFLADEPAEYIPMNGMESMKGRQVEAGETAIFRVNYREGYTHKMRVSFRDNYYGITDIRPVEGMFREYDLVTKVVKS